MQYIPNLGTNEKEWADVLKYYNLTEDQLMNISADEVMALILKDRDILESSGRYWGNFKELTCKDQRRDLFYALRAIKDAKQKEIQKVLKHAEKQKKYAKICDVVASIFSTGDLSNSEAEFLNNIRNKRVLTERQEKWLRDIADKNHIGIYGEFKRSAKKAEGKIRNSECIWDKLEAEYGSTSAFYFDDIVCDCPACRNS